jgi:predicted transcriptional regulator
MPRPDRADEFVLRGADDHVVGSEVRRLHFAGGLSIREIHRRTGLHRDTIRGALRSDEAPR